MEFGLESFDLLSSGEFDAELLNFGLLVRSVVAGPEPGLVAGLELAKLAEAVGGFDEVVGDDFASLILAHNEPDF